MKEVGPGARRWMPCVNNALGGWILCLIIKHAGYFGILWDIIMGYYGIFGQFVDIDIVTTKGHGFLMSFLGMTLSFSAFQELQR